MGNHEGKEAKGRLGNTYCKEKTLFLAQFIIISHVTQRPKGPFRMSVSFDGWRILDRKRKVFQTETPIIFFFSPNCFHSCKESLLFNVLGTTVSSDAATDRAHAVKNKTSCTLLSVNRIDLLDSLKKIKTSKQLVGEREVVSRT